MRRLEEFVTGLIEALLNIGLLIGYIAGLVFVVRLVVGA